MYENKYRIPTDIKLMRRGKINEHLHDLLTKNHCLYLQGLAGCSKTYTLYSLVLEFYKNRYVYYHLDQDDNNIDTFNEHMSLAFQMASIDPNQIDKPYLFVLDQFEVIDNLQVLETLKTFIEYRPNHLDIIIASRQCVPEILRDFLLYHKLFLVEDCSLFYERNEIIQIQKNYVRKKINPHKIYQLTLGWPVLVNYYLYHSTNDIDNHVINDFFDHLSLSESMHKILQIVSFASYTTLELLESLDFDNLEEDLFYLYLNSLLYNDHHKIYTIPVLSYYYQRKYDHLKKDILQLCLPYYLEHNDKVDILYCYYHSDDEKLLSYVKENVFDMESICNISQYKKVVDKLTNHTDKEVLYLKGLYALYMNYESLYNHILNQFKDDPQYYYNLTYRNETMDYHTYLPLKNKDIRLYTITGNTASVIGGLKDLCYSYKLKYTNPSHYELIKQKLNDDEMLYYDLGEIEYDFYTGQYRKSLEALDEYAMSHTNLPIDLYMVIATLYFKIYYCAGLKVNALDYYQQYASHIIDDRSNYQLSKFMEYYTIYIDCLLQNHEQVYNWYRDNRTEDNTTYESHFHIYLQARYYYMSEHYDKAFLYFNKLENYISRRNRVIDLSECLFAEACCLYALNDKDKSLLKATSSFSLGGGYKLIFPYITYDQYGLEVLTMYQEMLNDTSDVMYDNNIVNKSYQDYIDDIIDTSKKTH
ncbi:MAG: hypothetical protein LUH02_01345 [Erysipelotrichaceae bacterium]|nr:hypothetical protein [Erysipelotrichaceae bacterium]